MCPVFVKVLVNRITASAELTMVPWNLISPPRPSSATATAIEASNPHNFWQLSRISRLDIESEAINRALAIVIDGQHNLPMADI